MTSSQERATHRRYFWAVQIGIWVVYGQSLSFALTNWDDYEWIVSNELVTNPGARGWVQQWLTPSMGYPQGSVVASQALDHWIGSGEAWAFHFTNVLLHSLNAALVWRLFERQGLRGFGRTVAVALWALHPIGVEAVCWATGRKDLLLVFFALVSADAFARWLVEKRSRWAWVSGLAAALCFATKPTSVVLPGLVALELLRTRQRPSLAQTVHLVGLGLAAAIVAVVSFGSSRAQGAVDSLAAPAALVRAVSHLGLQLVHVVVPVGLSPHYRWPSGSVWFVLGIGGVLGMVVAIAVSLRRQRRAGAAGLLWAALGFAPVSGLVSLVRGPADSYAYLPLIGAASWLGTWLPRAPSPRVALAAGVGALLVMTASADHARVYRGSSTLWQRVVDLNPRSDFAHQALGDALISENQLARAVPHLEQAVELSGDTPDPEALRALARACHSLQRNDCTTRMYARVAEERRTLADALCFVASFERHPLQRSRAAYEAASSRVAAELERVHDDASLGDVLGRSISLDGVVEDWLPTTSLAVPAPTRRALLALSSPLPPKHGKSD